MIKDEFETFCNDCFCKLKPEYIFKRIIHFFRIQNIHSKEIFIFFRIPEYSFKRNIHSNKTFIFSKEAVSPRASTDFVCSALSLELGATDLCDERDGTASEQTSQRPWASGDDGDEDRHNQNQTDHKEDDGDDGGMEQENPYFLTQGWNTASLNIG